MKNIIIRPILTEKTNALAENPLLNQYTFEVDKKANKVQIKKAVEEQFGVTVNAVNTSIRPGKAKARVVKGRHTKGRTSAIKKAIVTIAEGEYIDGFFGESDMNEVELINDKEEADA
ncbi:MAG: 50S ribosomal protein L23 [Saprospiraceae bacterium]|nr:50S ribosomal protein L23 [Saprospiraceae bacterium]